jgi:hypothetical protein
LFIATSFDPTRTPGVDAHQTMATASLPRQTLTQFKETSLGTPDHARHLKPTPDWSAA